MISHLCLRLGLSSFHGEAQLVPLAAKQTGIEPWVSTGIWWLKPTLLGITWDRHGYIIFHDFSPDSAAAGCCCQSAALWGLGAAPLQGAAAGCHWRALLKRSAVGVVCALELGCWCRTLQQGATAGCCCRVRNNARNRSSARQQQ